MLIFFGAKCSGCLNTLYDFTEKTLDGVDVCAVEVNNYSNALTSLQTSSLSLIEKIQISDKAITENDTNSAIDSAIAKVCSAMHLAYAIDTDCGAYKYINPELGVEISDILLKAAMYPETFSITEVWHQADAPSEIDVPKIVDTAVSTGLETDDR